MYSWLNFSLDTGMVRRKNTAGGAQCTVNSEVPQGVVLGALYFLPYVNDITSNLKLFADDTCTLLYDLVHDRKTPTIQSLKSPE